MQPARRFLAVAAATAAAAAFAPTLPAGAQHAHRVTLPDLSTATLSAAGDVAEIPFRRINNHLIVPLSVNGSEPLDVVLDTGMPAHGLALHDGPEVEALDLAIDPSIRAAVGGAGGEGERITARVAMDAKLSLPGVEIDGARVILLPAMHGFAGYHQGIIGYALFGRYVVEIDEGERVVRLHPPDGYRIPEGGIVLPLTFENRLPYTTVTLLQPGREPVAAKVVVDLGASHAISLNRGHSDAIVLPAETVSTLLGRGISGPVRGEAGRLAGLDLGGARLENVVASYPVAEHQNPRGIDSLAGNLGSDVLRRFDVTFDYAGERMILVPNESFSEPFAFDRSGLRLTPGDELEVEDVIAGSPAAEAGIEIGDRLTSLGGRRVSAADYGEVRSALMGDGEIRLTLERDGEIFERTLSLRRLI